MSTIFITAPQKAASDLTKMLLEERLAACVNRLPCESSYRWEGEIHHDEEVILLAKTTEEAAAELIDRVQDRHPYDVPCIERFEEAHVLESFAEWRADAVDGALE